MLDEVIILRVATTLGAATFCFFKGALGFCVSEVAAQVQEQFTIQGIHSGYWTSEVLFEQLMGGLGIALAGVEPAQCLFSDCVGGRLFTICGDMPRQAGILGTPLARADLGDHWTKVGGVPLIEGLKFGIAARR
ncbi:hypothetical protein A9W96_11075 [Mycobacterium sp. 1245852.3]|nr:hypothetical protein A9W96_11075 [Mycobacterium sp. 1245852.3]